MAVRTFDLTRPAVIRAFTFGALVERYLRDWRSRVRQARHNRAAFYDRAWREAAALLGATVQPLGDGILEISLGALRARVRDNYTSLDDPVTLKLAGSKPAVYRLLQQRGLPTPNFTTFTPRSLASATAFLDCSAGACVVKPARGTGAGQGITIGVQRRTQLVRATAIAAAYCNELVIERQMEGDNYRLLYLDGVLLEAVRRRPPTVVGDGQRSIRQLVHDANASRLKDGWQAAQALIPLDYGMKRTLARQGLTLRSIPAPGQRVAVKTVINYNAAEENEPVTGLLAEAIVAAGSAAASAIGVRLAGVDIITPDPALPLEDAGGVILEVNTTPGLYHHKRGEQCPVTATILEAMLATQGARPKPPRTRAERRPHYSLH